MLSSTLKTLTVCLALAIVGCKQAASDSSTAHPPLLPAAQSQAVLRILDKTDELDKMIRRGNAGQPFVDLTNQIELEHMRCDNDLPQQNAAREELKRIIDGYRTARAIVAGRAKHPTLTPVDLVAESYIRKVMLRRVLTGKATERDWQAFEIGTNPGN